MSALFLEPDEIATLTGRRIKSLQIVWLRQQGIPFRVNATGHPVVTRSTIDSGTSEAPPARGWTPRVLSAGA